MEDFTHFECYAYEGCFHSGRDLFFIFSIKTKQNKTKQITTTGRLTIVLPSPLPPSFFPSHFSLSLSFPSHLFFSLSLTLLLEKPPCAIFIFVSLFVCFLRLFRSLTWYLYSPVSPISLNEKSIIHALPTNGYPSMILQLVLPN